MIGPGVSTAPVPLWWRFFAALGGEANHGDLSLLISLPDMGPSSIEPGIQSSFKFARWVPPLHFMTSLSVLSPRLFPLPV